MHWLVNFKMKVYFFFVVFLTVFFTAAFLTVFLTVFLTAAFLTVFFTAAFFFAAMVNHSFQSVKILAMFCAWTDYIYSGVLMDSLSNKFIASKMTN